MMLLRARFCREAVATDRLWKERYNASLVDSEHYVMACYRYIEMNSMRTGMVVGPGERFRRIWRLCLAASRRPSVAGTRSCGSGAVAEAGAGWIYSCGVTQTQRPLLPTAAPRQ